MKGRNIEKSTEQALTRDVLQRVPPGQRFVQEAFTSDRRRPVLVRLSEMHADTFYYFDEIGACAFCDAIVDSAMHHGNGRLTLSCSVYGEFQSQQRRLQRIASKVERLRVLAVGACGRVAGGDNSISVHGITGTVLANYRIAMSEGVPHLLFVCREAASDRQRAVGFFTWDAETIDQIADDIELILRGIAARFVTFERLQMLHETTQRVTRELESYSRRMELAIRRARRRPDLLTPARFDRIVGQAITKMEQLKEIPRRALRAIDSPRY
ncbi:MAG TPA: hypothetical protein VLZ12_06320 [Verrucomicrobiae bacterium]|nr:hypothetical protein [Verrucomicrobiae bacterium]